MKIYRKSTIYFRRAVFWTQKGIVYKLNSTTIIDVYGCSVLLYTVLHIT